MSQFLTTVTHRHFDEIDSTNTALINAITHGQLPHTAHHLYTASHQTAGRGQHGRSWVSGADNVFLSLYVPLGQNEFDLYRLSGLLSLAVGFELANLDIIKQINQHRQSHDLPIIGVKWANDVGFFDETLGIFKKLAGILIEPVFKQLDKNTLVGIVIGVGLNVNNSPIIKDGLYQATCVNELIDDLAFCKLCAKEFYAPMTNAILQAVASCNLVQADETRLKSFIGQFNKNHLLTDKFVQIFMQNDMNTVHASGICIGIGQDGELLLNHGDDITPIYAGMAKIKSK